MLLASCSIKNKNVKNSKEVDKESLSVTKVFNYDNKKFEISIDYKIGYNKFVFFKNNNSFNAAILVAIQVFNIDNELIVFQDSWKDSIVVSYYNETRSALKEYDFIKELELEKGNYRVKVITQDLDNNNTYSLEKKLYLSTSSGYGESFLYINGDNSENIILKDFYKIDKESITDKMMLKFQYFQDTHSINELVLQLNSNDVDYTEKFNNIEMDANGFYSIIFDVPDDIYGQLNLLFSISDYELAKQIEIVDKSNILWTNDIDEIVGVMRYVLSSEHMKNIKELSASEKMKYIIDYWNIKDPEPETQVNELVVELSERVDYVNNNFSDLGDGWRSDRGRVYIIYGHPDSIDRYSNQTDGIYEVWTYTSGLKFTFLDRNRFGNYVLVRQGI